MSIRLVYRKARSKRAKKAGTYYIEGRYKGNRVHESLGTGDRDRANDEYAKRLAALTEESELGPKAVANFASAIVAYHKELQRDGKETNSNVAWLDEMLPLIGQKRLCELTQADLDDLAAKMRPKGSAETRKRQVYTPFIAAYNAAVECDPPLADWKKWKSPKHKKRRAESPDDGYVSRLVHAADLHEIKSTKTRSGKIGGTRIGSLNPTRDKAAILFITFTGARSGEAQRVALRDLFLDRGYALLRKTKNDDPRQVALTPELTEALRAQIVSLAARGQVAEDTLVFECKTRWGIPQLIARARKRAGLKHYRPHQVGRHAFATRLLNAGKSTAAVKQAGGWKSESRAFDEYYSHLAQEVTDEAVASMKFASKAENNDGISVTQNDTQNSEASENPNKSAA